METDVPSVSPDPDQRRDAASTLLGFVVAGALIGYGMRHRGVFGTAAGIAGAGVLATVLTPRVTPRAGGVRRRGRAVDVTSEFVVARPRSEAFDFFRNFENFPLLGGLLHSVDDFDDGRSRWRVMGRGTLIEWDVIVTKYLPPRVIGWESAGGAPVESSGTVRFDALGPETTRVCVNLHYRPLTDAAARAFHGLLVRRPERRVRAALSRIDAAMDRALEPGVHHREPRYPLPDGPASTSPSAPEPGAAPTQH